MSTPQQAVELVGTPCAGRGQLFTSTLVEYHLEAAALCADCPGRRLCLVAAETEKHAEGTYGGVLFVNGERRSA